VPDDAVSFTDIEAAAETLAGHLRETPLVRSESLSEATGCQAYLKLEHQQITGSFKLRGATNAVRRLSAAERANGVVGVSTGNHGRGLAYAAREAGVPCIICMSRLVPKNKVDGIKAQGAEVRIVGESQDDAQLEVDRLVAEEGMTMLCVTHEMGFAKTVANRVIFMDEGQIIEENEPHEFFDNPQHERTQLFLSQILAH